MSNYVMKQNLILRYHSKYHQLRATVFLSKIRSKSIRPHQTCPINEQTIITFPGNSGSEWIIRP